MLNFLNNIGPTEIGIVVLILIIFFGGRAIMGLARTSGETVKEIKKIKKTFNTAIEDNSDKSGKN